MRHHQKRKRKRILRWSLIATGSAAIAGVVVLVLTLIIPFRSKNGPINEPAITGIGCYVFQKDSDLYSFMQSHGGCFAVISCRKESADRVVLLSRMIRRLNSWAVEHLEYLKNYDEVEFYYDYGQAEIAPLIGDVFSDLGIQVRFMKRTQQESTLLQVADLLCEYALLQFKYDQGNFTHGEEAFFGLRGKLKKDLLVPIKKKTLVLGRPYGSCMNTQAEIT